MPLWISRAVVCLVLLLPLTVYAKDESAEKLVGFLNYTAWGVPKDKVDLSALSAKVASIVTDDPETREKVANHFAQWFSQYPGIAVEVRKSSQNDIRVSALGTGTFGNFKGLVFVVEDRLVGDRKPIGNFYLLELSQDKSSPRVIDVVYANEALSYATWMAYDLYFAKNPSKGLLQRFIPSAELSDQDWTIFQSIWEHRGREEWKEVMAGFDMLSPKVRVSPLMLALKYKLLDQLEIDKPRVGAANFAIKQRHLKSTAKVVEQVYGDSIYTALRLLPWYWDQDLYQKMSKALSVVESNFGLTDAIIRHLVKSYSESGDYKSAVRYAQIRLENEPNERNYAALVEILLGAKDYEQALVYAKQAYNEYKDKDNAVLVAAVHSLLGNKKQVRQFRQLLLDQYGMQALQIDMVLSLTSKDFKTFVKLLDDNKEQVPLTPSDMEGQLIFADFLKSKEYAKWAKRFD
ncbi:hypothetical protein KJY73_05540 [Bowmanella sp. Y26]|uniref:tetratricopeptide repeat protein n=1 Tax=Bowmanella yangjiangensis TaxID=2811230 RepID=UPI001BDDB758|nr:hypothetical protein [Bowmanella yangjiangensis]MBT1063028.1 hypothetical protein [Bowmanella yangjiangensis]